MRGNIGNKIYRQRVDKVTLSGTSVTLDMQSKPERQFELSGSSALTIAISNMIDGAICGFSFKKTTASDVVATFPSNTVSASSDWASLDLTMSGAENSWHDISIKAVDDAGTMKYFLSYSGEQA